MTPATERITQFFAEVGVAGLVLPNGWFGRPHDNQHTLTGVTTDAETLTVELDGCQRLTFEGPVTLERSSPSTLRITGFTRLSWRWIEYGNNSSPVHREEFGPGGVEFMAPSVADASQRQGERPGPARKTTPPGGAGGGRVA